MKLQAFRAAFPKTVPVMAGYLFLGMAYGIYMKVSGFNFLYPMCMAFFIYGGSMEFVAVSLMLSPFAPVQAFVMAIMIQLRHLFYGIAMLDKYKGVGKKKFYIIYTLSDETFSVSYSAEIPKGVDRGWFYFFISFLDHMYWVAGAAVGGLVGSILPFPTDGLDFVMTAMFVVIFLDQWLKEKKHYTALIGMAGAIVCRLLFTADNFMIPTMIVILAALTLFRKPIEKEGGFVE